jgi:16S rRNA (cytosine967-C5)-methyltransferase
MAGDRRPAERLLVSYFRGRRYAGSGDRSAISATLMGLLRCWGELLWRMREAASERLMLAAYIHFVDGVTLEGLTERFDGSTYGPQPLSESEIAGLRAAYRSGEMPDWARGNYPAWLDPRLEQAFGADKAQEVAALNRQAPVDLRVNTLKTRQEKVLARFSADAIAALAGPYSPCCVRLQGRRRIENHPLMKNGHVEIQDEGSQLLAQICDVKPGWQVVDYCAGAGGKSLALAAMMAGKGQVYAFDNDGRRLARLKPRQKRAGAHNIQPHVLAAEEDGLISSLGGNCQRVLVDAPCSGSGTWRRHPGAAWRLSADALSDYQATQARILDAAAPLVAPGGRLIYATCSIFTGENEEQVDEFLARHGDFALVPIRGIWQQLIGAPPAGVDDVMKLTPYRHGTDGYFAAVLERCAPALDSPRSEP